MPDREKVKNGLEVCRDQDNPPGYRFTSCVDDCPYHGNGCARKLKEDAIALLKEQGKQKFFVDAEGKITPLPIVFPNCPLKEQEDKPVLDEFGKCFLNALKRQLDMKLTMIELLITPEFAEKIVELIEKMFD